MKKSNLYGLIALVLTFVMIFSVMVSASAAGSLTTQEIDQILNTTTDTSLTSNAVTEAVAKVYDSVVLVRNYTVTRSSNYGYGWGWGWGYDNDYGNNQGTERLAGFGSGTVVTEYGHVLTNYHVIEGASRVTVFDGDKEYAAEVVAYDEDKDVAVLLAPELERPAVELGDSDSLQVGETAIVIGNPMSENFFRTTTVGVISSMDREIKSQSVDKYGRRGTTTNSMIQTDAAINSGNSGGGMFNTAGQLIGIPTLKYTGSRYSSNATVESIGMCIPINEAKDVIEAALTGKGNAARPDEKNQEKGSTGDLSGKPRMGVSVSTLGDTRGQLPKGVLIGSVEEGSPAEKAGLKVGDIMVEVNGQVITSVSEEIEIVGKLKEGDEVAVKVFRSAKISEKGLPASTEGEYIDLKVTLAMIDAVEQ